MLPKYLSKTEKQALKEFKTKILEKLKGDVLELKLFGSKARGDFHKDSDIDVLVVLKNKTSRKEDFIFDLAVNNLLKYGIDLSIKIFSEKEYKYLNSIPTVFMQLFQKEAVSL